MFDKLFTPITIKDMTLRNRIIMPAMGTRFTEDRFVNEKHIAYHVARARGGSALNIVEASSVHALSAPKMFLSIAEDKYIPKLKKLTDAIHAEGGKAGIQLWQGGLAVGMDQTAMILLSSDTELAHGFTVPGISKEMIAEVVDCYGKAAARAVAAGFDCIEFHCAHNYLPHSFLSDGLNYRTDAYGGSLENRARFPLECIRAIRAAMPEGMPLFMRIDAQDDGFGEAGLTVEDTITFCNWAKDAGVDVLDVSRGNIVTAASKYEVPPLDLPRGFNVDNAARIRKGTGMLTIGVGRINDPQQAEDILEADKVDMVVMGRAQLADPDFCNKCREGRVEEIDRCVGCNQGCLDGFADLNMPHITCLRNPAIGRETECAAAMQPTQSPKTILIAGGGIAGLEAARTLKLKGHDPILCEAGDALEAACRKLGIGYLALGDAAGARRAMNATREAFDAALRVDDETFMQDICENWVPESFWRKAYNLSSGKGWRFTCWEFTNLMMEGMGMTFADTQDPRRMAKYNFHGHYFSDADVLNDILHFRCIDPKTYQQGIVDSMKAMMQNPMIAAMIPGAEAMKAQNVQIGHKRMGYDWMMENNETDWINAFFGSKEEAEAIPSLEEGYKLFHPSEEEQKLDHGYDESKDFETLDLEDMKKAAAFRGGEMVSDKMEGVYQPLVWKCAFGHTFKATPNTVLRGGHWCPECQRSEWHYAEIARKNPFYAQVWKPIHGDKHDYHIPMAYSAFDITEKLKKELNIED